MSSGAGLGAGEKRGVEMESGLEASAQSTAPQGASETKSVDVDALLNEARNLVSGTDALFEKHGLSRSRLTNAFLQNGIAALGAQMRSEEAKAEAPKVIKNKKPKKARVRL